MAKDAEADSSSWVSLNVGGKLFSTSIHTLTLREPDSMLAAMFSGRHTLKREDGFVLIDRDGDYFGYILNWLRDGDVPDLEAHSYKQLLKEAEYFQLRGLIDGINSIQISDFTRLEVIKCMQSSVKTFRGVNLSGLDLSKLDLSGTDFTYACLRNVSFSCANLNGSKFSNADIEGASFCRSDLGYSVFSGTKIGGISFVGASFHCARFNDATLECTNFSCAYLGHTNFSHAHLTDIDLSKLNLNTANFSNARLKNVRFSGASLKEVCFDGVDAEGVIFDNATLEKCKFVKSNILGGSFIGARFALGDLTGARLFNCSFVGADLKNAELRDAEFTNSNLEGAILSRFISFSTRRSIKFIKSICSGWLQSPSPAINLLDCRSTLMHRKKEGGRIVVGPMENIASHQLLHR